MDVPYRRTVCIHAKVNVIEKEGPQVRRLPSRSLDLLACAINYRFRG
jgi:hypothetical protein